VRIDLILASEALRAQCTFCQIDVEPRKLERPSDHAPVIAQFN
jgi:exodeoxyribonuclease-3